MFDYNLWDFKKNVRFSENFEMVQNLLNKFVQWKFLQKFSGKIFPKIQRNDKKYLGEII